MDRKIAKKPIYKKSKFWYSAFGAAIFLILIIMILADTGSKLNVEADKITISTVSEGDFQEFIPITGNVLPKTTIYLDAIQGGAVEKIFVEEGAKLKKGDKILKLSNSSLQLMVLQQESSIYEQMNNLRNLRLSIQQNSNNLEQRFNDVNYNLVKSKRTYNRQKMMWAKKLISQQEYEDARDEYNLYQAQMRLAAENFKKDSLLKESQLRQIDDGLKRLNTNLKLVRENLENLTIKAPIDGQLTALDAEIGQSKSPGNKLGQIDVLDGFKVRAMIDEYYIARVKKGQEASVTISGNDYRLAVQKVYPEVKDGRFEVDMLFIGNEPEGIRRGQTLQIRLELSELTKAVMVPRGGFYQKTGGQWIFVVDPSGDFAVKRDIKLGRQNTEYYELLDGLKPGEKVITSSYDNFGEVDKLIIKN